ncbi:MAG: hypothetical protein J7M12_00670 [Candidatus Hydrogenedentes bacterium]|nr:hypothetical protein [Candidatus Hydrogenedentota bacterium]
MTNRRERIIVILAIASLAIVAVDKLVVPPLYSIWNGRAERILTLERSIEQGKLLVDRKGILLEQWTSMKKRCLPVDQSQAENTVFKSVNRWASTSGFNITSIKPRWIDDRRATDHRKLLLQAVGTGRYSDMWRFLYELERDPLGLKIENVEISTSDQRGDKMTLGLSFSGLVLKEEQK